MTMILSTWGLKWPESAASICGGGGDARHTLVFTLQCHPADRQRRAYGEGGGAYHVPGDVLDVLEFAANRGQDHLGAALAVQQLLDFGLAEGLGPKQRAALREHQEPHQNQSKSLHHHLLLLLVLLHSPLSGSRGSAAGCCPASLPDCAASSP